VTGLCDWPQIAELYRLLIDVAPNPVAALGHAVAVAMVHGPRVGLDMLEPLTADKRMADNHRLHAVRAHLLEMAGDHDNARVGYRRAARLTTSLPEQRYLLARAADLDARAALPSQTGPDQPTQPTHGLEQGRAAAREMA
jgi:predicted RNA polymerase sigma factor